MPDFPKRNFTGGEIAPALHARADLQKYQNGLATLRNFVIHPQGGVSNRAGTKFVDECNTKSGSGGARRLIPFEFNKDQAYILEFGEDYMRVVRNDGLVLESAVQATITNITAANPPVVTATNSFSNGDEIFIDSVVGMTEVNSRRFIVQNRTASDFELAGIDGTGFTAYTSGGTADRIFELVTPYGELDLPLLKFTQSADVMTITHPSYAPRNLSRTDHDVWSLDVISYIPSISAPTGPTATGGGSGGGANNKDYEYVVTAVDEQGEESLASVAANETTNSLDATHYNSVTWNVNVNADYYNIYKAESEVSDIYGWIGESNTTSFRDYNLLPDISLTPPQQREPFNATDDYPGCVTYYQQRQIFGRTNNNPQTVYATQSGNFTSFRLSRPTRADDAIERTIASQTVNEIRHFIDVDGLIVFTSDGEWLMTEGQEDVLTPASAGFRQQTSWGCSHIPPIKIGDSGVFVTASNKRVRDIAFSFQSDGFGGSELSLLASHLFEDRTISEWAYAQEPDGVVWMVMSDGDLVGMTYLREHQIWGFHRHDTNGIVESVASIPSSSDIDQVYFVVRRTIDGQTRRYIERLESRITSAAEDSFFVDSGLTYDGSAATTISGLRHLATEDVVALADGNVVTGLTVSADGEITLPVAASKVHVGFSYTSDFETLDLDLANTFASSRGNPKSVAELVVKLWKSRGGFAGPTSDNLIEFPSRTVGDGYDPLALKTEERRTHLPNEWTENGRLFIRQTDPLPMTILSVVPEIEIG